MNILFLISVELYMSPVETWCHNINYYIPDEGNETKNLSMEQMARIRKLIFVKNLQVSDLIFFEQF